MTPSAVPPVTTPGGTAGRLSWGREMASRRRPAPLRAALACGCAFTLAVSAGCGGDDGPSTAASTAVPTAPATVADQDAVRRDAAAAYRALQTRLNPRILQARTRIEAAERTGGLPALADALAGYAALCREARSALVGIRMPVAAYDPAAAVANALSDTAVASEDAVLALRAGRLPTAAQRAALERAVAAQGTSTARLRAALGITS